MKKSAEKPTILVIQSLQKQQCCCIHLRTPTKRTYMNRTSEGFYSHPLDFIFGFQPKRLWGRSKAKYFFFYYLNTVKLHSIQFNKLTHEVHFIALQTFEKLLEFLQ
jgi:hypothetical protein